MKEYKKIHNADEKKINLSFSYLSTETKKVADYLEQRLSPSSFVADSNIDGIQCRVMQKPDPYTGSTDNYFILMQVKMNKTLMIFRETGRNIYQIIELVIKKIEEAFTKASLEYQLSYSRA